MQAAIDQFRSNIQHVRNLHSLYTYFSTATTAVLDLSDLLRAQIVLSVSALDHYVHELTRMGMIEIFELKRSTTPAFLRFQVTLDGAINGIQSTGSGWLDGEIRTKHGFATFQREDKIADAIRLISTVELWKEVSVRLGIPAAHIKNRLQMIVDRRNKIAHEADIDPSYAIGIRWAITPADATGATDFVEQVCETIHLVVV